MYGFDCMVCQHRVTLEFSRQQDYQRASAWLGPARAALVEGARPVAAARMTDREVIVQRGPEDDFESSVPMERLESLLIHWTGALSPQARVLHAACVKLFGRAIVFVAPSGGGKSTLCRAALNLGGEYVTDDLVSVSPDRLSGLARAIRFKEFVAGHEKGEPWLEGMDCESQRRTWRGARWIVPIHSGDHRPLASLPMDQSVVVVVLERGPDNVIPLDDLERVVALHEAAIVRWGEYDGSLGSGPTFRLSWQDPQRALGLLGHELGKDRD